MEFGWWSKHTDRGKIHVRAIVHGGNIEWFWNQGHGRSWEPHEPSAEDWDKLMMEAGKRVPRRLLSPKQFTAIKSLRPVDG